MKEWQYNEIIDFLKEWVKKEGLCRFCMHGRLCSYSRRGRQQCGRYEFSYEMDCFHLWIACFDIDNYIRGKLCFREGYRHQDDYPWKNEPPEEDIPPWDLPSELEEKGMRKKVQLKILKRKKYNLMQIIEDAKNAPEELERVENEIKNLQNN